MWKQKPIRRAALSTSPNSSKGLRELTWADARRLTRNGRTVTALEELDNDLAFAKALYLTRCEHQSEKRRREDRERAAKIIKIAKNLANLFDEGGRRAVRLPLHMECPEAYLSQVVEAAENTLKPKPASALDRQLGERFMLELGIGRLSAFEWLAGQHLCEIYKKHFQSEPKAHPGSAYVCWVEMELVKLRITFNGKPYERDAIVRAMTLAKNGGRKVGKSH
jgi:hypothetical protein